MWEFAAFENLHVSLDYNPVWSRLFYLLSEIVGPPGRKSCIVRNYLFIFTFATPAFTNAEAPKIEILCLNQSKMMN